MNFLELAKNRYSERFFDSRQIEQEKLDKILEAGRIVPTACNYQPQKFYLIRSKEGLEKLKTVTRFHYNVPLMILVCYDAREVWTNPGDRYYRNYNSGEQDASIAATTMMYHLLLKGGTAINLTIFDLPCLSVDIDMDFTPNYEKSDMMVMRKEISNTILDYIESEGYTLSTASRFHQSLDAFYFTYRNAAGNKDMIKLELNYSLRAHILNPTKRIITIDTFGNDIGIMTVDPVEIFAAKANALLSRVAAKDLYDMNTMITQGLFENQKDLMRKCMKNQAQASKITRQNERSGHGPVTCMRLTL